MNAPRSDEPNRDMLGRLYEGLATAVVVLDGQLRLLLMNPSAEMLFGISARQHVGEPLSKMIGTDPGLIGELERCIHEGHTFTDREVNLRLPAGRKATVDLTVSATGESYLDSELLLELRQVDRRVRIEREEQLHAQYETARELVRGLAHEVKNPLGGIRGAAQLLERELSGAELKEYTGIIIREADRLRKLVDRLLGPNHLPKRRPVNLHEVLEQVRALVEAEAGDGVVFRRDYDPSIPPIQADPDQLVQAVLNIVRNAVEALSGRGVVSLRTRVQRQFTIGHRRNRLVARIDIVDNGPGIQKEMLERIFMPMISDRPSGTGIGLSIAQSLIHQHRGLIECSSRRGETVFTILLPLDTANDET